MPRKRKGREARGETIVRSLCITRDEAEAMDLTALVPADLKSEREQERRQMADKRAQRRDLVDEAILDGLSNAEIIHAYNREYGVSRQFVHSRRKKFEVGQFAQVAFSEALI